MPLEGAARRWLRLLTALQCAHKLPGRRTGLRFSRSDMQLGPLPTPRARAMSSRPYSGSIEFEACARGRRVDHRTKLTDSDRLRATFGVSQSTIRPGVPRIFKEVGRHAADRRSEFLQKREGAIGSTFVRTEEGNRTFHIQSSLTHCSTGSRVRCECVSRTPARSAHLLNALRRVINVA